MHNLASSDHTAVVITQWELWELVRKVKAQWIKVQHVIVKEVLHTLGSTSATKLFLAPDYVCMAQFWSLVTCSYSSQGWAFGVLLQSICMLYVLCVLFGLLRWGFMVPFYCFLASVLYTCFSMYLGSVQLLFVSSSSQTLPCSSWWTSVCWGAGQHVSVPPSDF